MARTTAKPRAYPKASVLTAGPLVGCRDSTDPTTADVRLARSLRNMLRASGPVGSAQVGRPGTVQMGDALGDVVQAGGLTWTDVNGIRLTNAVVDGEIWSYDWVSDAWTKVVTTANLTTASATLSDTARVALWGFADQLVISDGVNFAIWWDGTAGAAGITVLPVKFYGKPTTYYSKLCGIDATNRQTLFWSEEGDATIGYYLGYNNAWDNPGGYTDPLVVVTGTNDALYVQRERNSLAILGAMSADFQTAGTRANISADVGTLSPWGVQPIDQGVMFVDADAHPWVMKIGVGLLPLWKDCEEVVKDVPRLSLPNATLVYDEASSVMVLGLASSGLLGPSKWLVFHTDDLQYNGYWYGWSESMSADTVIDQFGVKRWSHADALGGRILAHGSPLIGPWSDSVGGETVAIQKEVIGPFLGFDIKNGFFVNQAFVGFTSGTQVTVGYQTSRGYGSFNVFPLSATGLAQFIMGVSLLGIGILGSQVFSSQATAGLAGNGRWISIIIRHDQINEPFGHDVHRFDIGITQGNPRQL